IFIQRAKQNLAYPANFILIAAANPCPCGYYKHPEKECSCTGSQVASYKRKLSGPLLDRIDIFCWAGSVTYEDLNRVHNPTASSEIKIKVQKARDLQKQRFKNENFLTNSEMHDSHLKKYCQLDPASNALLKDLVDTGQLSARGYHRVLKVARTIADLDENENITAKNLTEALSYRKRENN
ncbi:MAG: ATP-binding protein, partial [Candidatus Gribaldobacteria bacterium]|nr:ATP-binding protein [Candidatus Gribaldobacteria bacterium]